MDNETKRAAYEIIGEGLAELDDGAMSATEAIACVVKMLCQCEGQVFTRKMAEERARNIVTVWMHIPIRDKV